MTTNVKPQMFPEGSTFPIPTRSATTTYRQKLINIFGANLITLQPLSETSGGVATNYGSGGNGTYNSVTLADTIHPAGTPAPLFDGINSYIENLVTGLNSSFDFDEYTVMSWIKVPSWTGSHYIAQGSKDNLSDNRFELWHSNVYEYGAVRSGVFNLDSVAPAIADTNWKCFLSTLSMIANEIRFYENGIASGNIITGLTAQGGIIWTDYFLGAPNSGLTSKFTGHMAYHLLANGAVNSATALDVSTV